MPFCACGLVTGAYSFLLLALAVQAESLYSIPTEEALDQIDGLLTNVKVIVAGLEAYGTMWAGIDVMACKFSLLSSRLSVSLTSSRGSRSARCGHTTPF